jgi:hypothetical protein
MLGVYGGDGTIVPCSGLFGSPNKQAEERDQAGEGRSV